MNYRHAYHAGNFADVLKHATLALVIEHLKQKPAPFRIIDTHAGPGMYELDSLEANKTGEWREGIGRVIASQRSPEIAAILKPYLDAVLLDSPDGELRTYPGSPMLARRLLRPDDRLIANELHPVDAETLAEVFRRDRQVKVSRLDGWTALKAFLPPKERRGALLIDPPFEQPGELDRLALGLEMALRRFATGTVLLWYPIKSPATIEAFRGAIAHSCPRPALDVELMLRRPDDPSRLNGTGLVMVNPPYQLSEKLQLLLPFLSKTLGTQDASWSMRWLAGESSAHGGHRHDAPNEI